MLGTLHISNVCKSIALIIPFVKTRVKLMVISPIIPFKRSINNVPMIVPFLLVSLSTRHGYLSINT